MADDAELDLPPRVAAHDAAIQARLAGLPWDKINAFVAAKRQESLAAGVSDQQIDDFLGFKPGSAVTDRLRAGFTRNIVPKDTDG
jgi:hypothetical protein